MVKKTNYHGLLCLVWFLLCTQEGFVCMFDVAEKDQESYSLPSGLLFVCGIGLSLLALALKQ